MHTIVIFASGRGTNAAAIIDHFRNSDSVRIGLIVSNKADAGVLDIARREQIPAQVIDRTKFNDEAFLQQIKELNPALIVLAGFLWKIPDAFIAAFRGKIVNIHPALLPEFGGKGMYGHHVHEAVLAAGRKESGITIHYVDEIYDNGDIIMQARCAVRPGDDASTLAERIHELEHFFFPKTLEFLLRKKI